MEFCQLLFSNTAANGADFLKTSNTPKVAEDKTATNSIFNSEWNIAAEIQNKVGKNIQELIIKDYSVVDQNKLIEFQNNNLKTSDIESTIINIIKCESLDRVPDEQDILFEDEKESDILVLENLYNIEGLQKEIIESPVLEKLSDDGILPEINETAALKSLIKTTGSKQTYQINQNIEQISEKNPNNTVAKTAKLTDEGISPKIKETPALKSLIKGADSKQAGEINQDIEHKSGKDPNNTNIKVDLLNNASFDRAEILDRVPKNYITRFINSDLNIKDIASLEAENTIQNKDKNTDISRVELKESGNFKEKSDYPGFKQNASELNQNKIMLSNVETKAFEKTKIAGEAIKQGVSKANSSIAIATTDDNKNSEPFSKDQLSIPSGSQITGKINEVNSKLTIPQVEQKPINNSDIIRQVAKRLVLTVKNGKQGVNIKLRPALLGNVMLDIFTEKGQVTVKIMAEHLHIKEIIETNLHHLKAELQNHNLEIQKFDVLLDQGSGQSNKGNADAQLKNTQNQSFNKESEKGDAKKEDQISNPENKKKDRGVDFFA